jgi:hypothetical protein
MDLLQKQRIEVRAEGELVVLKIGSAEMRMPYEPAIQLSTWLRGRCKEAKRVAGDDSRRGSIIGNLDAVMHGERPW